MSKHNRYRSQMDDLAQKVTASHSHSHSHSNSAFSIPTPLASIAAPTIIDQDEVIMSDTSIVDPMAAATATATATACDPTTSPTTGPTTSAANLDPVPAPNLADLPAEDMVTVLSTLPADKLAKLKLAVAKTGIVDQPSTTRSGSRTLVDGRMEFSIIIDRDLIGPLESWAEASGIDLSTQLQQIVDVCVPGFLMGTEWAGTPSPSAVNVVPPIPAGTPATMAP